MTINKQKEQCQKWDTLQEMGFIDECADGLPRKERRAWLERYRGACLRRAEWCDVSPYAVIDYIDQKLITECGPVAVNGAGR